MLKFFHKNRLKITSLMGFLIVVVIGSLLMLPSVSSAEAFPNPLGSLTWAAFLKKILDLIILIALPVLGVMFALTGFALVRDAENSDKRKEHIQALGGIAIGGAVVLGAKIISEILETTIKCLEPGAAGC